MHNKISWNKCSEKDQNQAKKNAIKIPSLEWRYDCLVDLLPTGKRKRSRFVTFSCPVGLMTPQTWLPPRPEIRSIFLEIFYSALTSYLFSPPTFLHLSPHKERHEKDFQAALMGNVFSTCFTAQPKGVNERWDWLNALLGRILAAHRQTSRAQKGRVSFIKAPFTFTYIRDLEYRYEN